MAQRVDYAVFPGVREEAFLATVNKVFGHVRRSQLNTREFREWMKDEGLWNKDDAQQILSLLDLHTDGTARLGPWAEKFFGAADDEQTKEMLYKRLADENTLLCKYVLEALDTEGGGRLHSTYELHRMLTSYVYPGKPIALVPFQNWIKWIVASGRVKLIGIRWGLTDLGKQAVPRLRAIDVDEYMEDEAAAALAGAPPPPPQPATAPAAVAPVAAAAPVPAAKAVPTKKKAADADPEEEFLDMPPESEPVDESVYQKYEHRFDPAETQSDSGKLVPTKAAQHGSTSALRSQAPRPQPQAQPVQVALASGEAETYVSTATSLPRQTATLGVVVRQMRAETACSAAPLEFAEVLNSLRTYGREHKLGGGSLLLAHGLESRMAQSEAVRHLMLAALLARLYSLRPDGSLVDLLTERVGGLGPVAVLLDRPEALAEVVVRWGLGQGDPASTALRAALLDAVLGGRALKAQADLPTVLAEAPSAEVLIGLLNQGLLRGAPVTAQLWLVREMVRAGLWTRPSALDIAFVPTRAVRLMAYRLRLLDSHFAQGAAMMIQVARRLAPLFPPGSVEAAALAELAPSDHLRFDCARVPICQQPCAYAPMHGEPA